MIQRIFKCKRISNLFIRIMHRKSTEYVFFQYMRIVIIDMILHNFALVNILFKISYELEFRIHDIL